MGCGFRGPRLPVAHKNVLLGDADAACAFHHLGSGIYATSERWGPEITTRHMVSISIYNVQFPKSTTNNIYAHREAQHR